MGLWYKLFWSRGCADERGELVAGNGETGV